MRVFLVGLLFCIVIAAAVSCKTARTASTASTSSLKAGDYVTEFAKVIDEPTKKQLETTLAAFKERTAIDFAVVITDSTDDQDIYDVSLALAQERRKNIVGPYVSGLLLLVAVDDRNWHVQITRNLETQLTKEVLTDLSTPMTDLFKQKRYGEGILKYVNALIAKLEQQKAQKTQKIVNHQC
jgi:uncharacterized membrane protein YgcG